MQSLSLNHRGPDLQPVQEMRAQGLATDVAARRLDDDAKESAKSRLSHLLRATTNVTSKYHHPQRVCSCGDVLSMRPQQVSHCMEKCITAKLQG